MMNCNRNPLSTEATRKALCDFYIAACTEDGGAYRFRLYEDGKAEQIQKIPMPSPMFLQMEKEREAHKDESEKWVEALNKNTNVIATLTEVIKNGNSNN